MSSDAQGQRRPQLIGELLVRARVITAEQLAEVLAGPRDPAKKLGLALVEKGLLTETQLTQTLSQQLSIPWVSLAHVDFSPQLLARVPVELAERCGLVPIFIRSVKGQGEALYVAMDDPTNLDVLAEVSRIVGLPARPMIAAPSEIRSAIRIYYYGEVPEEPPQTRADTPSAGSPNPAPATPLVASQPGAAPPPPPVVAAPIPPPAPSSPHAPSVPSAPAVPSVGVASKPLPGAEGEPTPSTHRSSPPAAADVRRSDLPPRRSSRPPPSGAKLVSLTLLDGTTIQLPARSARKSFIQDDALTARDVISALRAAAHGADASEILGNRTQWEPIMAALLSILIRKGLVGDAELMDELRKI